MRKDFVDLSSGTRALNDTSSFHYVHTLFILTAEALTRISVCAGLSETPMSPMR